MADDLPLPALLSAAFVALTIEVDNEAERLVAHTTTSHGDPGGRGSVWLTSLAMWFNCLGPLAAGPLSVEGLEAAARMPTNLDGMRRWGLITVDGVGRVRRGTPRPRATRRSMLALTERGQAAEATWRPLPGLVEQRWRRRFGASALDELRSALLAITTGDEVPLPDFLPIGRIGTNLAKDAPMAQDVPMTHDAPARFGRDRPADGSLPLVSLLARVLMRFELAFEAGTPVPLVGWANLLRVLPADEPVPVRVLPGPTGVSKEALAVVTGRFERAGCVVVGPRPAPARGRQVGLTDRGRAAQQAGLRRVDATLDEWRRGDDGCVQRLTDSLRPLVGDATRDGSPLFAGLKPPPEGWRAEVPPAEVLPWWPMVTHRGGYPDGS